MIIGHSLPALAQASRFSSSLASSFFSHPDPPFPAFHIPVKFRGDSLAVSSPGGWQVRINSAFNDFQVKAFCLRPALREISQGRPDTSLVLPPPGLRLPANSAHRPWVCRDDQARGARTFKPPIIFEPSVSPRSVTYRADPYLIAPLPTSPPPGKVFRAI